MPLRDIGEYHVWLAREVPSRAAQGIARAFIAEVGSEPWKAPSVPIADLSNQPEYEVRSAALQVPGEHTVWVWYLHTYATGSVDLIAVTNR